MKVVRGREARFSRPIRGSRELMTEIDKLKNGNTSVLLRNMELNNRRKS